MDEPYLGYIALVGFTFAPQGWALCNGQLLSIAENTALFSLLGTTYGGDGITTFGLPNLQSRVPVSQGQGPGLGNYALGQQFGAEAVTLTGQQVPAHPHLAGCSTAAANSTSPTGAVWAATKETIFSSQVPAAAMNPAAIGPNPGGQPHENRQPVLAVNFIIALQGIYPSRN